MTAATTQPTLDLRTVHRDLYAALEKHPQLVDVPELLALTTSGIGGPASGAWAAAVQSLFTLAYGLKNRLKNYDPPINAKVMPLEGIWSGPDDRAFADLEPEELSWTMLIVVPDCISLDDLDVCRDAAVRKKRELPLGDVQLERLDGGPAVQILHRGPYVEEGQVLQRLRVFASENGWNTEQAHREIYLNDPSRTAPERLKTILRVPLTH